MTKDVNQMNSVEYAEYKMQQNRQWKNQQYDRAMKDLEKQQRKAFLKDGLGFIFDEMKYNSNYNLETMQLNNLGNTISTVSNLSKANDIKKERDRLLNKFGTEEAIWDYQAASKAFSNPEIANLNIKTLKDLQTLAGNQMITPDQLKTYTNSYNVEKNRYKTLWNNDQSFDSYDDQFIGERIANLKTLQETKPSQSFLGIAQGKDQKTRDLIQSNYTKIFEENSAVAKALETRKSIIAGNVKTNVTQEEVDKVVAQNILSNDNIPFSTFKAQIAPEISKTQRLYVDADKIEANFDRLLKEKFEKNETFQVLDLWQEARRPFNRNFRYDEVDSVNKFITQLKKDGVASTTINELVKRDFGLDIELVAEAPISYASLAIQNNGTINNDLAAQLMISTEGKALLKAKPELLQDTAKAYGLLNEDEKTNYLTQAENRLISVAPYITDTAWISNTLGEDVSKSLDVTAQARKKVLDKLMVKTKGTAPDYINKSLIEEVNNIIGMTIYDLDKNNITGNEKNNEISKKIINLVDQLEITKNNQVVLRPTGSLSFSQFNIQKTLQDISQPVNPEVLKLNKAVNGFNLAQETFTQNTANEEAKNEMLTNAAIIINTAVKQDPSLNTIQKLRELSPEMRELLNTVELATPTTSVQELLDYLPKLSDSELAENIPADTLAPPPAPTPAPAPSPDNDLTGPPEPVLTPTVATPDIYDQFTNMQRGQYNNATRQLNEVKEQLKDTTNLSINELNSLNRNKDKLENRLRNLIENPGLGLVNREEKRLKEELNGIKRQLRFNKNFLKPSEITELEDQQKNIERQLQEFTPTKNTSSLLSANN